MLEKQILKLSKKYKRAHIGSNISTLPILEYIYVIKKKCERVVLDNAHAHVAHSLFTKGKPDMHCDRSIGCDASGGSLGHGLGISIGMALAGRGVHCIVSDGSMMEGSNWEALRIIDELNLKNIQIYANFNGYTAVAKCDTNLLKRRMEMFSPYIKFYFTYNGDGYDSIGGHYKKNIL